MIATHLRNVEVKEGGANQPMELEEVVNYFQDEDGQEEATAFCLRYLDFLVALR